MNKLCVVATCCIAFFGQSQSFAPAAGMEGSTAIAFDSSIIVNWANDIQVERGPMDVAFPNDGDASFGEPTDGLIASNSTTEVVSLGDGGVAILTFEHAIIDEAGPDFAIFENGFQDNYMEFAFVEVSSDGVNFVRFPATSEYPTDTQVGGFEITDCRYYNNLAGKYRVGFGTPFDLAELQDSSSLDLQNITHIRLIDVVGSIDTQYGTYDQFGTIINEAYPTAFESGGFDLDGVAVIHEKNAGLSAKNTFGFRVYPNPTSDVLNIQSSTATTYQLYTFEGKLVQESQLQSKQRKIHLSQYHTSVLFLELRSNSGIEVVKILLKE